MYWLGARTMRGQQRRASTRDAMSALQLFLAARTIYFRRGSPLPRRFVGLAFVTPARCHAWDGSQQGIDLERESMHGGNPG